MINQGILLIEAFAVGFNPVAAAAAAQVTELEATQFREANKDAIAARKRQIDESIGILSPVKRIELLNRVAQMCMEGYMVGVTKQGDPIESQNPAVVIQAVRAVNEMVNAGLQMPAGSNPESVLRSLFESLKKENPEKTDSELWGYVRNELPEYESLVNVLSSTRVM